MAGEVQMSDFIALHAAVFPPAPALSHSITDRRQRQEPRPRRQRNRISERCRQPCEVGVVLPLVRNRGVTRSYSTCIVLFRRLSGKAVAIARQQIAESRSQGWAVDDFRARGFEFRGPQTARPCGTNEMRCDGAHHPRQYLDFRSLSCGFSFRVPAASARAAGE